MSEKSLSNLIGMIYEASIEPGLWPDVLRHLASATPSVAAMISSHDKLAGTTIFHQSFGLNPDYMSVYAEKWSGADNPLVGALLLLEPGEVSGLPALIDFEAFKRHPFYLEWGKPQGYNDAINMMLERTPTRFASVSLIRNHEQGLADAATIKRLRILMPHFLRAIRIGRVLEHASIREETLVRTLDALASAVFLLSSIDEIVHANASAVRLADRGVTPERIVGAYKRCLRGEMGSLGGLMDRGASRGECSFRIETAGGDVFVCHGLPLALGVASRNSKPAATLVVVQAATSTESATKALASLFGLTPREQEVLFSLVEIGGITPTARLLGLSKETVKSHLKALFLKTHTHRQSDLVRLVAGWLTPFGPSV
ncbi:helix-turn-helix transcriptional regulator [Lichenifustis flavocetrariae]|uniref:HTH luxR-type domain-containing protein n=1 Tax=Lichenifustis flavocetrariae TaxID=2949735 RepID=A0AA42CRQ5_9HYPH|nr:hypothetical protein [Lichenifustis flavocetrariae]MCW6512710.1 hypothetical protein [Lichenifustis flavocetrariae]